MPQSKRSLSTEFYVMHSKVEMLLTCGASELFGVLRVGIPLNSCDVKSDSASNNPKQAD